MRFFLEPENRPNNDSLGIHAVRMRFDNEAVQKLKLERGDLIRIQTDKGCVYRIFLSGSNLKKNKLRMDYDTIRSLGLSSKDKADVDIHISKAPYFWNNWIFHWNHPDSSHRFGARAAAWWTITSIVVSNLITLVITG